MDDHTNRVRQFSLSRELTRVGLGVGLVVLAVLISLTIGFFVKASHRLRADRLATQNELLAGAVEEMRSRISLLGNSLDELSQSGDLFRLVAGLVPIADGAY